MTDKTERPEGEEDQNDSFEKAWAEGEDPTPLKDAVRAAHEQAAKRELDEFVDAYRGEPEKKAGEGEKA